MTVSSTVGAISSVQIPVLQQFKQHWIVFF